VHHGEREIHDSASRSAVEHRRGRVVTYTWGDGERPVLLVHGWAARASLFADVVTALRATGVSVEATWIGDGEDEAALAALQRAHVRLTGWLPSQRVPALLAEQSLYVHTAAWEAGPIAVLDAMAAGVVVVARRIDAYEGLLPPHWLFDEVSEAVEMIRTLRHGLACETRIRQQYETLERFKTRGPAAVLGQVYCEIASSEAGATVDDAWR
jgi:glycosyltransferase involved in cell wall biosynthesis